MTHWITAVAFDAVLAEMAEPSHPLEATLRCVIALADNSHPCKALECNPNASSAFVVSSLPLQIESIRFDSLVGRKYGQISLPYQELGLEIEESCEYPWTFPNLEERLHFERVILL